MGAALVVVLMLKPQLPKVTKVIAILLFFSLWWGPVLGFALDRQGVVVFVEEEVAIISSSQNANRYERAVDSSTFGDIKVGDVVKIAERDVEEGSDDLHWYVVSVTRK
jgi:hypothetical protein